MSVDHTLCPAYILAGGQSRRFGSDKARHIIDGQVQLLRMRDWLHSAGHSVYIVADHAQRFCDLGISALVDELPQAGPLAGLATALAHQRHQTGNHQCYQNGKHQPPPPTAGQTDRPAADIRGWLLLTSCDQTCWQSQWYQQLVQHARPTYQAVCYYDQYWHPLPGLYHTSLLEIVRGRLAQDQLSLQGLLDAVTAYRLITAQPPSQHSFNTPTEL